ncbi:hypothetical protein [Campylobacter sp.]|uniref:hypothetical protein n=1 Tax=Campylobacter sp. TaxID=205 RepID=UPI002AA6A80C|nr:hypothetical protein [Campylobacter sp.]MCI7236503.1 hypothetical protein [Campylobacter sp.]
MSISLLGQNFHFSFSNLNSRVESPEASTELLKPVSFGSNDIKLGDESISLLKSKFGSSVAEIDGQIKLSSEAGQFVNAMFSALKSDLQDISSKFAQALEYYSLDTSDWCEPISLATILQMLLKAEISGQNALSNEEKLLVKSSFGADSLEKISQKLDLGGEFKALKIDLATNILADMSKGFKV